MPTTQEKIDALNNRIAGLEIKKTAADTKASDAKAAIDTKATTRKSILDSRAATKKAGLDIKIQALQDEIAELEAE